MDFLNLEPIIILIAGKARSGKDTLAAYFKEEFEKKEKKVIFSPYTKYLKQYIKDITGKEVLEDYKPRQLLQKLSSDLIKKKLGCEDFFIHRQLEDLEFYSYFFDVIIVADVRFPKEIEIVKSKFKNVISIGIVRDHFDNGLSLEEKADITETALDDYKAYDYLIDNHIHTNLKEEAIKIVHDLERR